MHCARAERISRERTEKRRLPDMLHRFATFVGGVLLGSFVTMESPAQDRYAAERKAMLEEIARTTRGTRAARRAGRS